MKRIKLLIIILLSLSLQINAQHKNNLKVTYKKSILNHTFSNTNTDVNKALRDINNKIQIIVKDLNFTLTISDGNKSLFKLGANKTAIEGEEMYNKLAISTGAGKGVFYSDLKLNEMIHQIETGGNTFLVENKIGDTTWLITNETKKIGKYLCFKATTTMTVNNIHNTVKNVIAWYCPNIPYSFGPVGYGGLPGLILELKIENTVSFIVNEFVYNTEVNIKKPNKGKKVTKKEFFKISKEMYKNRINGL